MVLWYLRFASVTLRFFLPLPVPGSDNDSCWRDMSPDPVCVMWNACGLLDWVKYIFSSAWSSCPITLQRSLEDI
jgi:hypothetical protein